MLKIEDLKAGDNLLDQDGDRYDIIAVLVEHDMIVAQIKSDGSQEWQPPRTYDRSSLNSYGATKCKPKLVRYVNVYSDDDLHALPKTVDEADAKNDNGERIARVRIEFGEGQFDA